MDDFDFNNEAELVDWTKVTQSEGTNLGLLLGKHREAKTMYKVAQGERRGVVEALILFTFFLVPTLFWPHTPAWFFHGFAILFTSALLVTVLIDVLKSRRAFEASSRTVQECVHQLAKNNPKH